MNRTITRLVAAAGVTAAVLTFSTTVAHAETPPAPQPGFEIGLGPVDPPHPDGPGEIKAPVPSPQPPKGPQDLAQPPAKPQPPKGPQDLADSPKDPVVDPAPGDSSDPATTKPGTTKPGTFKPGATSPGEREQTTRPTIQLDRKAPVDAVADAPTASTDVPVAGEHHVLPWLLAAAGAGLGSLVLVAARRRKQADEA